MAQHGPLPVPAGLEEALRQLSAHERWAWPEHMSNENPSAGAAQQVLLVLCGRVATALRLATASPDQALAALQAVRRSLGSETVLAKRLTEVLEVEAGCILTTGQAAADQGVAVITDFLSSYVKLEEQEAAHLRSQAGRAALLAGLESCLPGRGLGKLILPTLLECILAGTTRSWECDWEAVRPQLQPLHDMVLDQPLLEDAASNLLELVRNRAPALLPELPDSDVDADEEEGLRQSQKRRLLQEDPTPRCIYSLACLAQEIQDSYVAEGVQDAHGEEISQMTQLQHEVMQRLAKQAAQHGCSGAIARQRNSPTAPVVQAAVKHCQARTPSPRKVTVTAPAASLETPPRPCMSAGSRGPCDSRSGAAPKALPKATRKVLKGCGPAPVEQTTTVTLREQPESSGSGQVFPDLANVPRSRLEDNGSEGVRAFMEEIVNGFGAQEIASCLLGRVEKAIETISTSCSARNGSAEEAVDREKNSDAVSAAEKLGDIARYLRLLLEIRQDSQQAVASQVDRLIRCLLESASWPAGWRHSLCNMLELITHPLLAKQAAAELWQQVTSESGKSKLSTGPGALAVGSLASELMHVLEKDDTEEGEKALAPMKCLKLSAEIFLRWLHRLAPKGPLGVPPVPCTEHALDKDVQQRIEDEPCSSGKVDETSLRSSDSEADLSEDVASEATPSAPSIASGDRASDLDDFIDWRPECNIGLLQRSRSPPRGPTSSGAAETSGLPAGDSKGSSYKSYHSKLSQKVQDFCNSSLVPDWEARVRSLLLKRPAAPTESTKSPSSESDSAAVSMGALAQDCKRKRMEFTESSGLLSAIA
eukprot:TRINITY_DN52259_c0_g1_i1.p1 TRINITY_DN52259_c0_g1~~TRINITY_DN52259_c0_g1_i1.p1  ORF type:complete len:820 (+),score=180.18 TRINITY_DN52259_c0_g1_i1:64-2523(+)